MTFEEALTIARNGGIITNKRIGVDSKFIFMRPSDNIEVGTIIEDIKSLPQSFKDKLTEAGLSYGYSIEFTEYLCLCDPPNKRVVNGWYPSQIDLIADDWSEVVL